MARTAVSAFARPLSPDDEAELAPIDAAYARRHGLEPLVTAGSLSFYTRSGHAFVSVVAGRATGFVLAHAVWNGVRPTVLAARLAVLDEDAAASRRALLSALTKSAYDAAVYDLAVMQVGTDPQGQAALAKMDYREAQLRLFERKLGSRGRRRD